MTDFGFGSSSLRFQREEVVGPQNNYWRRTDGKTGIQLEQPILLCLGQEFQTR